MSNQLLNAAWKVTGLTVAEKIILVRLADRADKDGKCFPGHASLAADCSLSDRCVRYALPQLQAKRHLTIKRDSRKAFKGESVFSYIVHPTPATASGATPANGASDTGKWRHSHRQITYPTPANPAPPYIEPVLTHNNPQGNQSPPVQGTGEGTGEVFV